MPLLSANDLCAAVEAVLREHLPDLAASRGLDPVRTWQQLPTLDALTAANLPGIAVTSPGLSTTPTRRATRYDATWRIVVGCFVRATDHATTAAATRDWAAVIRQVMLQHPTLGGVATGVEWAGEEYAERPERSSARTLGGCAVALDVTARNVIDAEPYVVPDPDAPPAPTVQSTSTRVSVR